MKHQTKQCNRKLCAGCLIWCRQEYCERCSARLRTSDATWNLKDALKRKEEAA